MVNIELLKYTGFGSEEIAKDLCKTENDVCCRKILKINTSGTPTPSGSSNNMGMIIGLVIGG